MSGRPNDQYPNKNAKASIKPKHPVNNSADVSYETTGQLNKHQPSSHDCQVADHNPWRYTYLNNVKVVYNAQDAKTYIRKMAEILEINHHEGSNAFIEQMLERVNYITKSSDGPLEHFYNDPHEKCYILVLVETKKDYIAIGYSYHSITDVMNNDSSNGDTFVPPRNVFEWFKTKARESLRMPAGIVSNVINNKNEMTQFQKQQSLEPSEQQSMEHSCYDNRQKQSTYAVFSTQLGRPDDTMDQ